MQSDASYLTGPKVCSKVGGHLFLGKQTTEGKHINVNGSIHTTSTILKHVVASAVESQLLALYINAQEGKNM